jgi:iron complex outermembrane recepter protein
MTIRFSSAVALSAMAVALCSPAIASDGAADTETGSNIIVTGIRSEMPTSSGTKSAAPILETPQSISVITAEDITGLGLSNLNQTLRYVAGVTPETRGANAEIYDQFKLRGFDAPRYLDGLKVFTSATGYADAQIDVSRIDRIEVVKGPASVLYGQSSPGGLVAITSKLPLDKSIYGGIAGSYGTYDLYRLDADVGGRIAPGLIWRLYGSANGADTQQSFGKRRRETASGTIAANLGTSTSLTVLAAYSHDPENGNYGAAPAIGTLIASFYGQVPTKFANGEPGDFFKREQAGLTYILSHDFRGGWGFRSSGHYQYVSTDLGAIYTTGIPTDATLMIFSRGSYATTEKLNNWTFDNQLTGHIATGPITHSLLFGLDRQVAHSSELAAFGDATPINAYHPVYGTMATPRTPADVGTAFPYDVRQRQTGLYVQDQMAWGGLRLTLSGREDWAHANSSGVVQNDRKFTWRVGGLYLTPIGLAPYVSYSTSFEPQSGQVPHTDGSISNARPSLGKQVEAGLKYQSPGTGLLVTAAWFRIEQTNLLTAIPNSIYATQSGKVRSQGFEMEATLPLSHGFTARGAFSHQTVKTVADTETPSNIGQGLIGAGRGNTSVNLDWKPASGPLTGLTLGAGVRHVDAVYGGSGYSTPSYTLVDALLRYDLGKTSPRLQGVNLSVNAANIFDRKYLTSCYIYGVGWCWYGQRRTVQATIGYRW